MKIKLSPAFQMALIFLCFGILWIVLSDAISYNFSSADIARFVDLQLYKGLLFMFLFSILIYLTSDRFFRRLHKAGKDREEVLIKNHLLEIAIADQKLQYKNELAREVFEAQDAERKKIGEELHDNINQLLGVVKLYMEQAQHKPEKSDELLKKGITYQMLAISEIRALTKSLVSSTLADIGLMESINELIESISQSKDIRITLKAEAFSESVLSRAKKQMVYRILQELLNNILKHSLANEATIALQHKGKDVLLLAEDNGIGFDIDKVKRGAGLNNIRNRLASFNGEMKLYSAPGKGCRAEVVFEA